MKRLFQGWMLFYSLCVSTIVSGQDVRWIDSTAPPQKRAAFYGTIALHGVAATGSWLALYQSWYADYPRQAFQSANDWNDWNQMDKLGHLWTAYSLARLSSSTWKSAGVSTPKADLIGSLSAFGYQSLIEVADGFSANWGFSWSDFVTNLMGVNLYLAQQTAWHQQRLQLKVMAYKPYPYERRLEGRADQLLGRGLLNRLLNDYNVQTYWISANIRAFVPKSRLPAWLGFSLGYGSRLMLGRRENRWLSPTGDPMDRSDIARYRRFFIAPSVDLTTIRTRSRFVRSVFLLLNTLQLPSPALEFSTQGKIRGHLLLLN
ncbi:DUF2279 domain-containing protein [Larkinella sp. VNQ87]|uniref:DUF2279 domain-containing protein n=1 Tax=Larkinella sp. VNQ87 TaxID=3400921 RepID=UPI003C0CB133